MNRHARAIAAKDLRIEPRVREVVPTMPLFAALVAILLYAPGFEHRGGFAQPVLLAD